MSFRQRMKKTKSDKKLRRRHDSGGIKPESKGKFPTVVLKNKLPEGIESWWCKEGKHLIDIIPFFAGPDFPLDSDLVPIVEEGEMTYKLELFVHMNVGNMNKPYVCPFENFGKPCPICEFIKANKLDKEDWKALVPKHRVFYLVWIHDNSEEGKENEKKGVMLWEVAGFFMEEKLEEISALPEGGGFEHFWHPDTGKKIAWTRKGTKNTEYLGHRFIDRQSPIPEKILNQGFAIDSVIDMYPEYDLIEKEFKGTLKKMKLLVTDEEEDTEDTPFNHSTGEMPDWTNEESDTGTRKRKRKRTTARKKKTTSTTAKRTPSSSSGTVKRKRTVRRKK